MNNNELSQSIEKEEKQKVTAGRVVHLTAAIVLFIVATAAMALLIAFSSSVLQFAFGERGLDALVLVFLLPCMFVFAVVGFVISLIGFILSSTVWRYRLGREKTFGAVSTIVNLLYIVASVALPLVSIMLFNTNG